MRWVIEDDLAAFAPAVLPWLEREPVVNNVLYTIVGTRYAGELPVEEGALWARLVDAEGAVQAVAVRTPPHPLLLSPLSPGGAEALVEALRGHDLAGVSGPTEAVRGFLAAWRRLGGGDVERAMAQRMYRLDTVTPPTGVPGRLRAATPEDEPLAIRWTLGFTGDTAGHVGVPAEDATRHRIATKRLWLWEQDGIPVSIACTMLPAAGVTRVGLVYTPPEYRRRGYASACIAAVSQLTLDGGARACMLYTDVANPTSNAIYQAIGYRPVTDAEVWSFKAPA